MLRRVDTQAKLHHGDKISDALAGALADEPTGQVFAMFDGTRWDYVQRNKEEVDRWGNWPLAEAILVYFDAEPPPGAADERELDRRSRELGGSYRILELRPFPTWARSTLQQLDFKPDPQEDGILWFGPEEPAAGWRAVRQVHGMPKFRDLMKKIYWVAPGCGCTKRMISRRVATFGWRADTYCTRHDPRLARERALVEGDRLEEEAGMSFDAAIDVLRAHVEAVVIAAERAAWFAYRAEFDLAAGLRCPDGFTDAMAAIEKEGREQERQRVLSGWSLESARRERFEKHHSIVRAVPPKKGTRSAYWRLEVVDRGFRHRTDPSAAALDVYAFVEAPSGNVHTTVAVWTPGASRDEPATLTYERGSRIRNLNVWSFVSDPTRYVQHLKAKGLFALHTL